MSTGAFQRPFRSAGTATLPRGLLQIDACSYRTPAELPDGAVLIVGSGPTGCQIAEELHTAGRDVWLACGRAPWMPRRIGDWDVVRWGVEIGFFDEPVCSLPSPAARLLANVQTTGNDGGRDLHYRTLRTMGVTLLGRFLGCNGRRARFAPDLGDSVAWGDQVHARLMSLIRKVAAERGLPVPDVPAPEPFSGETPETLDLSGFGAIVFAGGFRPNYASWIRARGAFDALGFPVQHDGASTVVPGLCFVGVPFLRKRKSALFMGIGEDAAIVAGHIARSHHAGHARPV